MDVLFWLIQLAMIGMMYAGMWMVFVRAGRQGWECLLPIYNIYVLFDIVYGEGVRMFMLLIPFYNIYVIIRLWVDLARKFGKNTGFAVGLLLMPSIFLLILGLDGGRIGGVAQSSRLLGPSVQVCFGPLKGAIYPITQNGIIIGRNYDCTICMPSDTMGISRQHCRISLSGDQLVLTDLNSSNGTYLHNIRLSPYNPVGLRRGDDFYLGGTSNRFRVM